MGRKKDTEEEITIDFSWLKNLFSTKESSKSKKGSKKRKSSGEDIEIELEDITSFVSKYGSLLLILIPIILSIYIRGLPAQVPIAEDWARQSIYNNIRNNIAQEVNKQFPNLQGQARQNMINSQLNDVVGQQSQQIEQAVQVQSEQIRSRFRDSSGVTYLGDIDSYYWMRYMRNIIEKGMYADENRNGALYDNHMLAPNGLRIERNFYPYFEAFLYRLANIFDSSFSYIEAAYYTPMVLSFFAIVAAFLIGKRLSGNLAGLIASVLVTVNPTVLSRSLGSDNDIVNAVFPLLIMLFVIYAFDAKTFKKKSIYAAIAGVMIGLYSFAWSGWWFMFQFIIGASFLYMGYLVVHKVHNDNRKPFKLLTEDNTLRHMYFFIAFFVIFSVLSLTAVGNLNKFLNSFDNPIDIVRIKQAARGSIWPNVYTTVAELNAANMPQILQSLGGRMFLWIALVGTLISLVNFNTEGFKKRINQIYLIASAFYLFIFVSLAAQNTVGLLFLLFLMSVPLLVGLLLSVVFDYDIKPQHSILMVIWFMATIYASTKGVRFILLIVPAFVVSFAAFFGSVKDWLTNFISSSLDISKVILQAVFIILILSVLVQPIRGGYSVAYGYAPSVSDAWVNSLIKIRQQSQPDAIINSWWDFGHWFKYFSDRAVTFDGASQNDQRAHWIGKVLLTDDEDQAVSILRMLDCGGHLAEQTTYNITRNSYDSVNLIYELLELDKEEARKRLSNIATQQQTQSIMDYMYCEPPEDYFITSGDMVGKSGVWAHFGSWNFERGKIYQEYQTKDFQGFIDNLTTDLNYSNDNAQRVFYQLNSFTTDRQINDWIAPWPSYGGSTGCSRVTNKTLQCNIPQQNQQVVPLRINLSDMNAYVESNQGRFYPNKFGYLEGEEFKSKEYQGNLLGYAVVLRPNKQSIVLMSPELTGSIFTRLFYMDGIGVENFNKFHDETSIGGTRIITWKVDWDE